MKKIFALLLTVSAATATQAQKMTPNRTPKTTVRQTPKTTVSQAQNTAGGAAFGKGVNYVNLGVGLGAQYGGGLPIGISYDRGVTDRISIGGQIDYYSWEYNTGYYKYTYRFMPIGLRGAYHFTELGDAEKLDVYAGLALGYFSTRFSSDAPSSFSYSDGYGSRIFLSAFAGGRYFFSPKAGVFGELGYGVAWLKAGVTLRF